MAEKEKQESSRKLSHSVIMGSDVLIDICCDICSEDGKQLEAVGFCEDCSDYLCDDCFRGHQKNRLSRNHHLQDKTSMPRNRPLTVATSKSSTDACTEPCERHPDRIAEYYCKDHNRMGCSVCMTVNHRMCKDVDHIPDFTDGLLDSQEYKQFEKGLEDLKAKSTQVIKVSKENVAKSERCSSNAVQKVLGLQNDINKLFDSLVDDIKQQSEAIKSDDLEKMKTVTETGNKVLNDTERNASNVDVMKRTGQLCKLFIHMKKTQDNLKSLGETLEETMSRNRVTDYFFESSVDVQGILDGLVSIGKIYTRTSVQEIVPPIVKDLEDITAVQIKDVNVKTGSDKLHGKCLVSGIETLLGNKLILTEYTNKKVKLVDLGSSEVTSELEMKARPWDIAVLSRTQAAVTLPLIKEIVFVNIARDLTEDRKMEVPEECRGIAYSNGKLVVTFVKPTNHVAIINLNGTVERKIGVDNVASAWLSHTACGPGNQSMYVSDHAAGSTGRVIYISPNGTKQFRQNNPDFKGFRGIAVDQLGRILVCGRASGTIILLNSDLTEAKVLVKGLKQPCGLSYCQHMNKLFVGFEEENFVREYQLS